MEVAAHRFGRICGQTSLPGLRRSACRRRASGRIRRCRFSSPPARPRSPKALSIPTATCSPALSPSSARCRSICATSGYFIRCVSCTRFRLSHVFGQFMGLWIPPLLAAEIHFENRLQAPRLLELIRRQRISRAGGGTARPRSAQVASGRQISRSSGAAGLRARPADMAAVVELS